MQTKALKLLTKQGSSHYTLQQQLICSLPTHSSLLLHCAPAMTMNACDHPNRQNFQPSRLSSIRPALASVGWGTDWGAPRAFSQFPLMNTIKTWAMAMQHSRALLHAPSSSSISYAALRTCMFADQMEGSLCSLLCATGMFSHI